LIDLRDKQLRTVIQEDLFLWHVLEQSASLSRRDTSARLRSWRMIAMNNLNHFRIKNQLHNKLVMEEKADAKG